MFAKKEIQYSKGFILLLLSFLTGCSGPEYHTKYYKAVSLDKRDTAWLKIEVSKDAFHGNYQIKYDDQSKDDGAITGAVRGDTLLGKFVYLSRNNVRLVHPITFLRSGEKLKLGTGKAGTYMGFHVYERGSLSYSDSLFQFQIIDKKKMSPFVNTGQ